MKNHRKQKSESVKTFLTGLDGKMGSLISKQIALNPDCYSLVGGTSGNQIVSFSPEKSFFSMASEAWLKALENVGLVIDFSHPSIHESMMEAVNKHLKKRDKSRSLTVFVGTTGIGQESSKYWRALAKKHPNLKVMIAPNTSLGIMVLSRILKSVSGFLFEKGFDIELLESHHKEKIDAPSGTALKLIADIKTALPQISPETEGRKGKREQRSLGVHSIRGGTVAGDHTIQFLGSHESLTLTHHAQSRELFADGALKLVGWLYKQPGGFYTMDDIPMVLPGATS